QRSRRNCAGCRMLTGLGSLCDQKCPATWEGHSQYLRKNLTKHHQWNGRTCRTPARKGCAYSVSKRTVGMNCRKTVHQLVPLTVAKASSDYSDGLRLVRRGSVLLRAGGDCRAHQNIPR